MYVDIVDLVKSFLTSIYYLLAKSASIQPRTGLSKFANPSQKLKTARKRIGTGASARRAAGTGACSPRSGSSSRRSNACLSAAAGDATEAFSNSELERIFSNFYLFST